LFFNIKCRINLPVKIIYPEIQMINEKGRIFLKNNASNFW